MNSRTTKIMLLALQTNDQDQNTLDHSLNLQNPNSSESEILNSASISHNDFNDNTESEGEPYEDSGSSYHPSNNEATRSSNEDSTDSEADIFLAEELRNEELLQERKERKGRPKKGRRNKYPNQTFKSRKKLKDSNKRHFTIKGKVVEPKKFINFNCNCPIKCSEKVSVLKREALFNEFWNLGSYNMQIGFIASSVREGAIKRKRSKESIKRQHSRTYQLGNDTICKNMYLKTYQISSKRVDTALKKLRCGKLQYHRGKLTGGINKLSEATVNEVITQIGKFPTYVSHYARAEKDARFLPPDLTLEKMYLLFKQDYNSKISFAAYKKIFYENFNLRRKAPIKDTCNTCDSLLIQIKNATHDADKARYEEQHAEHLNFAKETRMAMTKDFERAKKCETLEVLSYDMQKVMSLPKLPTNIVYYKRQLSLYNEGIHSASTDTSYFFLWKEGVAGRGAQEVGSCLKKFIDQFLPEGTKELILWSDSCGGQNRNIKITLLLKAVLASHKTLKVIKFKYLLPGHSFLRNDTDFGEIERAVKLQLRIYTLDEFKQIVTTCCKKKKAFITVDMTRDDFYGTKDIESAITNRKSYITGTKVSWLASREIKIDKSKPLSIFFKRKHTNEERNVGEGTAKEGAGLGAEEIVEVGAEEVVEVGAIDDLAEDAGEDDQLYEELDITKTKRGRPSSSDNNPISLSNLKVLYPEGKEISANKLTDIAFLMKFVPEDSRAFYSDLLPADFEDDVEGFGETVDFQIETE